MPEVVELVAQYGAATVRLRDALARATEETWLGLGSWREEDAARWLARLVPLVEGGLQAMTTLTDAYLTAVLAEMIGPEAAARSRGTARIPYPRPSVAPAEVYRRPLITTWTSLAQGRPVTAAIEAGRARAVNLATTDLQLAKRNATAARLAAEPRVVGYRRVLTGSKSCGMCALAATQRYRKERLMPIHPGCNCGVAPLVGDADPGQKINAARAKDREALDRGEVEELDTGSDPLHAAIAARFGGDAVDYRGQSYRDLVVEHEHGELGPVMARRGDRFTGPDDIH